MGVPCGDDSPQPLSFEACANYRTVIAILLESSNDMDHHHCGPDARASPRWFVSFLNSRSPLRRPRPLMAGSRASPVGLPLVMSRSPPRPASGGPASPDRKQPTVTLSPEPSLPALSTSPPLPSRALMQTVPCCCSV